MKKSVHTILALSLLLISSASFGQRWFKTSELEFGIIGGMSHYSGDLTQGYFETRGFKPSFGLITRYTPSDRFTFRLSAMRGEIMGDDNWYNDPDENNPRNLNFESVLWDFTAGAEWNLRTLGPKQTSGAIPYLFSGISVFKFNPISQFVYDPSSPHLARTGNNYADLLSRDGEYVELQPLGTEGQQTTEFNDRSFYHLTQLAIPIGVGVKFKLGPRWAVAVEYGMRITFTDYMDDVSTTYVDPLLIEGAYGSMAAAMADRSPQLHMAGEDERLNRGNGTKNDTYGILGVSITYRIFGNRDQCVTF